MTRLARVCALAATATLSISGAAAEEFEIKKLVYANKGGYGACIYLNWINEDGEKKKLGPTLLDGDQCPPTGQSRTINLNKITTSEKRELPKDGDEVWLMINIDAGEKKSCRKDNTRFIYRADGKTAKFKSSGTTLQNNRCRIVCKSC